MQEIQIPVWAGQGTGRIVRRDALSPEHPWSQYSYMKEHYPDLNPADYGVEVPLTHEYNRIGTLFHCKHCGNITTTENKNICHSREYAEPT